MISCLHIRALQSGLGPGFEGSEVVDSRPFEKANPTSKFNAWVKNSFLSNFGVLISNMIIVFWNSSPIIPKQGIFGPKFRHFYSSTRFCIWINSRALISKKTIVFQSFCPKHPNSPFLVLDFSILVFTQNFAVRKIRGCWSEKWQYLFQIPDQKYPNKGFFIPNLGIFILPRNFSIRQIRERGEDWFQLWQ